MIRVYVELLFHALLMSLPGLHINPEVISTCIWFAIMPPTGLCISAAARRV